LLPSARRAGLTLLELLAVVVVLTIVWAFVFPGTDAVRRSSRRREALTEAQSLATALLLYRDTYGHWPLQDLASQQDQDIVYGTNITVSGAALLDQAALIRALTPSLATNPDNPRNLAFIELDADRLSDGAFVDPWSTADRASPYVAAVDANGDGWIGAQTGSEIHPITVAAKPTGNPSHPIPAIQEPVYVFSWSDSVHTTNRVSTLRHQ
jgi:prepilin-type N-terminal cleavage/methylation domain-containing protein